MNKHTTVGLACAALLLAFVAVSCDRDRSNPLDPQSDLVEGRPQAPEQLSVQAGVGVIRLAWQAVGDRDLAGYAVLRSDRSNGTFAFVAGDGDSTAGITTGKTTFVDTVRGQNRTFFYRVAAVDTTGLRSELTAFQGTTALVDDIAPAPPQSLSVVPDEDDLGRVTLRWSAPQSDADGKDLSGLAGYVVLRSEADGGGAVAVDTVAASVREYADTGLKTLTTYGYSLVAFDEAGNVSRPSTGVQVTTSGLAAPTEVRASDDVGRIVLRWSAVGDETLIGYDVYRATSSDGSYQRLAGSEGTSFTTGRTSYIDSNLAGGTLMYYKVQAVGTGDLLSELSPFVSAESLADESAPGVPQNVGAAADENDPSRITVRWSAPALDADGGELTGLAGFFVSRAEDDGALLPVDTLAADAREYVDTGLKALTLYRYAVAAFDDQLNQGAQASSAATTAGVATPVGVRAIDEIGRIVVSWQPVDDDNLAGYDVYRATSSDGTYQRLAGGEGTSFTTGRTSYVDSNLTGGTLLFYKVQAIGANGLVSELSPFVGAESLADESAPGAPRNVGAVADENDPTRVTLRWSAPSFDADGGELTGLAGFFVLRAEADGALLPVDTLAADARQFVDGGLKALTSYRYSVAAFDAANNQSGQALSSATRTAGVATPSGLRAADEIGRIVVVWQAVADEDLAGYDLFRASASNGTYVRLTGTEGTSFTTGRTTYVDSNLAGGTLFYYKVQALSSNGLVSELSSFVSAEALADESAPGAPQNVGAVADENDPSRITVRWSAPTLDADGGELTGLAGFFVLRAEADGALLPVDTLAADARQFVDGGLKALTSYRYSVAAFDAADNQSGQALSSATRTAGVATPSGLRAADEIGRIVVAWQAVADEDLAGYDLFRASSSNGTYVRLTGTEGTSFTTGRTTYVDSNLVGGTLFYYKVQALSSNGLVSELSSFVSAEALADESAPGAPQNVGAVADENDPTRVTLRWSAPSFDADGGELTGLAGFFVLRAEADGALLPVDTLAADAREHIDGGLKALTTYRYAVTAFDADQNQSDMGNSSVRTAGVATPPGLQATNEIGRIVVAWQPVEDENLAGYDLFRASSSDGAFERLSGTEGTSFTTGRTTYIDSNLAGGTLFYYKVQAVAANGLASELSSFVSAEALTDESAPGTPQNVGAVADENDPSRITLRWSAPPRDADGGELTGLAGFFVLRAEGDGALLPVDTLAADVREFVDGGLKALTTYRYAVAAFDADQNQSAQGLSSATRTAGVATPSGVTASDDIGRIIVSWQPVNSSDLAGYDVFRATSSDGAYERLAGSEGTSFTTGRTSYVDSNLAGGTLLFYKVQAIDGNGLTSELSTFVGGRARADESAPASPQNVGAVPDENDPTRLTVRWSAPSRDADGGELTGLSGFYILRSEAGGALLPVDTLAADLRELIDTGLKPLTLYRYAVTAFDAALNQSVQGLSGSTSTSGIPTPTAVAAIDGIGQILVRWSAVDDDGLLGYDVFRSTSSDGTFERLAGIEGTSFTTGRTSFVDSNLAAGTLLYYKVQALGQGSITSDLSGVVSGEAQADESAPGAPQNISVIPSDTDPGSVTVRWTAPVSDANGGARTGLTGFRLLRAEGSAGSLVPVATLGASDRQFDDTGLTSLTTYRYALIAFDGAGNESSQSAAAQARTIGVAVPAAVTATDGIGRVDLSWAALDDDELIGYNVYRSTSPDGSFARLTGDGADAFTTGRTEFADTTATTDQLYYYKVSALTGALESERSNFVSGTPATDDVAPSTPTDLVAIADDSQALVSLSWAGSSSDQGGGDLTGLNGYIVFRGTGPTSLAAVDTVDAASTGYSDTGLDAATTYYYAVSAIDGDGNVSPRASTVSATTQGIAAPSTVVASGDIRSITVAWNASDEDDLLGYNVYRSSRSDEGYTRLAGTEGAPFTTGQTSYIDSNLSGGQILFYRISVVTSAGESEQSAFSGATAQVDSRAPEAPTSVAGEPVTGDPERLTLSWRAPNSDSNGATLTGVSGYNLYRSDSADGDFSEIGSTTTTAFEDSALLQRTTYFYQVEAFDADGNIGPKSITASATTGGVDQPSNVRIVSTTPSTGSPVVTVSWTGSAGAIVRYEVERTTVANSTNDGDYTAIVPNNLSTTRDDDTVTRGQTYYYRVRAVDVDSRESEWTEPLEITVSN